MFLQENQTVEGHCFVQPFRRRRIGLMGGTFNPVHIAHIDLARKANLQFDLDETLFVVAKNPPHKDPEEILDAHHRFQMVCLAIEGEQGMTPSTIELEREGVTYTVDTLKQFCAANVNTEYFYIIGSDTLYFLHTWRNIAEVFRFCSFIVFFRPGGDMENMLLYAQKLQKEYSANIIFSEYDGLDISSSEIRQKVQAGESIRGLVPEAVRQYIYENSLYGYIG